MTILQFYDTIETGVRTPVVNREALMPTALNGPAILTLISISLYFAVQTAKAVPETLIVWDKYLSSPAPIQPPPLPGRTEEEKRKGRAKG